MVQTLQYGTTLIEYEVAYQPRKTLAIHVHPDGRVTVDAPEGALQNEIEVAVRKRARWIIKQQRAFARRPAPPTPRQYVSGESHFYLGRQYRLKVQQSATRYEVVKMQRGRIVVSVQDTTNRDRVRQLLEDWYRRRAQVVVQERIDAWYPKLERFDIPYPQVTLRAMRSRWGSCTTSGTITLNPRLIQVPKDCIDYVIVHELCHLKEHNHSPQFYRLLSATMPDWKLRKDRLERWAT